MTNKLDAIGSKTIMDNDNFGSQNFNADNGYSPRHMHITNINFSDAMQNDLKKVLLIQDDLDGHNNIDI